MLFRSLQRYAAGDIPPVLGHIGVALDEARFAKLRDAVASAKADRDAMRARGETPARKLRGIAGLPAWAVREIWGWIEKCGAGVTLTQARDRFIADLRRALASLPPLGEKPAGYDAWLMSRRFSDEQTEWTREDDDRLGEMIWRRRKGDE